MGQMHAEKMESSRPVREFFVQPEKIFLFILVFSFIMLGSTSFRY